MVKGDLYPSPFGLSVPRWGLFLLRPSQAVDMAIEPIGGTCDAVRRCLHCHSADSVNRKLPGIGEDQVSRVVKALPPSGQDFRKTNNQRRSTTSRVL